MNLLLRIAGPNVTQDVPVSSSAETTLGRDASADVVLPDPDKWISRKHVAVRQTAEGIELRVVSTVNGVDTSRGPVERGQRISLVVGDHFTLGPYRMDVALGAGIAMAAVAPLRTPPSSPPAPSFGADDPFAARLGGGGSHRAVERNDDPFARPEFQPVARPPASDDKDPFGELLGFGQSPSNLPAAELGPLGDLLGAGSKRASEGYAPGGIGHPGMGSIGGSSDSNAQLNDWLGGGRGGRSAPSDAGSGPLDAFLGRGAPAAPRALSPDHVHGIHMPLSFGPPQAPPAAPSKPISSPVRAPSNSPPSDVWADLQGVASAPVAPPTVLTPPEPVVGGPSDPVVARPISNDNPFRNIDISIEDDAFSEWISTEPMPPNFERAFEDTGPPSISNPGSKETPAPTPDSEPATPAKRPDMVAPPAGQAGSWTAFARGLGLPPTHPSDEAAAERAGGMVKLLLEGLADLLSARADLKRELRAEDRTMLSGRDNNPLKLKLSPAELVQYLFAAQAAGGYMPAERAVRESITELRVHEHATIAAARAAVEGTLRDFEPGRLKKQLVKGKPGMFQMLDNAKLWDAYQQNYERQSEHMADWLETLFNRHFMPAYSRETERLKMQAADGDAGQPGG